MAIRNCGHGFMDVMTRSNANDTRTRNRRWKPVPENRYRFPARLTCNLVPNFCGSLPVYGTGFLVRVFCADFWYVCHWHNSFVVAEKRVITDQGYQNFSIFSGWGAAKADGAASVCWILVGNVSGGGHPALIVAFVAPCRLSDSVVATSLLSPTLTLWLTTSGKSSTSRIATRQHRPSVDLSSG